MLKQTVISDERFKQVNSFVIDNGENTGLYKAFYEPHYSLNTSLSFTQSRGELPVNWISHTNKGVVSATRNRVLKDLSRKEKDKVLKLIETNDILFAKDLMFDEINIKDFTDGAPAQFSLIYAIKLKHKKP